MERYGDATLLRHDDGRGTVERADPVIGISVELLAEAVGTSLWVGGDGLLWLAGDPRYRYRPVRFECTAPGVPADCAAEGTRVLVCERVGEGT